MKTKPIINDSNFQKMHNKQPHFVVRPKPSQLRLNPAPLRQLRFPVSLEIQRSVDECLAGLDSQLTDGQPMSRALCLRSKEHLLALRLKYSPPDQQSYNDNKKEQQSPMMIARKQSSKFIRGQKYQTVEQIRCKENFFSSDSLNPSKLRGKSNFEDYQLEIQALESKLKQMHEHLQQLQREYDSRIIQIRQLQSEIVREKKEKTELKIFLQSKQNTQKEMGEEIERLGKQYKALQEKNQSIMECISQREREIVTLWQLIAK